MKRIGFLVLILIAFFLVSCEENGKDKADYYSEKFSNFKKEKLETKYIDSVEHNNFLTAVREFLRTMSSRPSSAEMTKLITRYEKLLGDAETYISDFDSLSREYETYKQALSSRMSDKDVSQGELDKLKKEKAKLSGIDEKQRLIKSYLDEVAQLKGMNVKDTILEWLENNQYMVQVLDLVANFCLLGGAVWIVLGTISLAGSLKDKNGPTLQTSIWQIVGGSMIMVATYLFRNVAKYPNLLNEVLKIAAKFVNIGGALWMIWGVLILAGALKDKMGPALQTAIWQIVGGAMIIVASSLFGKIVTISL